MRRTIRLKLDCARSVLAFNRRHPAGGQAAEEAVMRLRSLVDQATALCQREERALAEMGAATVARGELAGALKRRMDPLIRLAAMAAERGLGECRLKPSCRLRSPGSFLRAARELLAAAQGYAPDLERCGLPAGSLEAIAADLTALEEVQARRHTAALAQAAAAAGLAGLVAETSRLVRHLDAINRLRLAAHPELLAEWCALSRVRWGAQAVSRGGQTAMLAAAHRG